MAAKRKASVLLHKESVPAPTPDTLPIPDPNADDAYAGFMKDADKLKLMLLAWNYQNSNAIRNGTASTNGVGGGGGGGVGGGGGGGGGDPPTAPDLNMVSGLWQQYQNALALNAKQPSVSPVHRNNDTASESPSVEQNCQDETNSSGQKDEDDGSEDDSDDKLDQNTAHDPERLKAFNMFVRLFVDENLDRMIPISKQPKEKIQAIIDSCARQFPEFSERSRKRIRTYLKSCRRNKKAREGWDNTSRPTPAHLTSVQAEQILALACENESMNAKRMRVGLDPISQSLPINGNNNNSIVNTVAPSTDYTNSGGGGGGGFRGTPTSSSSTISTTGSLINNNNNNNNNNILNGINDTDVTMTPVPTTNSTLNNINSARSSPLALNTNQTSTNVLDIKNLTTLQNGTNLINNNINNNNNNNNPLITNNNMNINQQSSSPLYRPTEFASPSQTNVTGGIGLNSSPPFPNVGNLNNGGISPANLAVNSKAPPSYPAFFPNGANNNNNNNNATPTDLSMKPQQQMQQQQPSLTSPQQNSNIIGGQQSPSRPPIVTHKLSANEITAARQVITAYRESAAFLLRTADQVEQLLMQQQ